LILADIRISVAYSPFLTHIENQIPESADTSVNLDDSAGQRAENAYFNFFVKLLVRQI